MDPLIEHLVNKDNVMFIREKILFTDMVKLMRETSTPHHYYNRFPWQARIVVDNIISLSQEKKRNLKVFLGNIWDFWGLTIIERLIEFSQAEREIDMIIAEPPKPVELARWRELIKELGRINVFVMPKYDETLSHLWLAGNAYRFEASHPHYDGPVTELGPERSARFAFHNKDDATYIRAYWDKILSIEGIKQFK